MGKKVRRIIVVIYNILKYIRADDRINERTDKYVRIIFYSKIGRRSREN